MQPLTAEWIAKAEGDWKSVDYRYPGILAGKDDARQAVTICRTLREKVRVSLGLPIP